VVVVRDDLLGRWGQGKLAVMISSAILSLYKRNYKSRDLRVPLLSWVSPAAALPAPGNSELADLCGLTDCHSGSVSVDDKVKLQIHCMDS
jgi:peptidyl-tRNA hydrolase